MNHLRFFAPGLVAVALAGCGDALQPPIQPDELTSPIGQAYGGGGMDKTDVCHRRDGRGFILITVADAAIPSHVEHGDARVGEAVPGMAGYAFDERCVPVEVIAPAPTDCILAAIEFHDLLSDPDWDFADYGPWAVGTDQPSSFSISGNGASASVADLGTGVLRCRVEDDAHGLFSEDVPGGSSEFAETRAFLLSLT